MSQDQHFHELITERQELSRRLKEIQSHIRNLKNRHARKSKYGYPKGTTLEILTKELESYQDLEKDLLKRIQTLEAELNWY